MNSKSGSVLIEGIAAVLLVSFAWGLNIELIRRVSWEWVLKEVSCEFVRESVLGKTPFGARREGHRRVAGALGRGRVSFSLEMLSQGLLGRVYTRYPSFYSFSYRRGTKHHFEVTQKCRYPFGSA